ncbi:MAG: NAD(+) synthase, partial [Spirochaetia bacterium]|nr:NAD(+) synthase [Spirochaetia bacterium]
MDTIRLAAVSLNQTPLDWRGNQERILEALKNVSVSSPDVIFFPELSISGYGCEDAFHSLNSLQRSYEILKSIADASRSILPESLIFTGLPVRHNDRIYNCMAAVSGGEILGMIPKQNLAGDGVHYEPRWFSAWRGKESVIPENIPIGPLIFEHKQVRIGIEICEDAWISARPAQIYAKNSIDILLNPSASHFSFGKQEVRKNIAKESSRQFGNIFISVNLLGCEAGRIIYDGGAIAASNGELIYESVRFSFQDSITSVMDLDLSANRTVRSRIYSRKEQAVSENSVITIIKTPFSQKSPVKTIGFSGKSSSSKGERKKSDHSYFPSQMFQENLTKEEEFEKSVALGLFDYMRKSKSRGYVISLSGGVDSSACAVLAQRMLLISAEELGITKALERLGLNHLVNDDANSFNKTEGHGSKGAARTDFEDFRRNIIPQILYTIYQSTKNSGEITQKASSSLAELLGSRHYVTSIDAAVQFYTETMENLIKRKLTWEQDDLTLQNIQARSRSPLAWMLANTTKSLLITTSNRSEAAVGYCTMDGDTSGGLAPLAGVDKAYLIKWLRHMEISGDQFGKIEALKAVNDQNPTAELRPPEESQTDEADLMPYDLLDIIERLAIRDRKPPLEIYRLIKARKLHPYSENPNQLKEAVSRFFRL